MTAAALAAAIAALPDYANVTAADLTRLRRKGVSHDHYAVAGRNIVARVPRLSQWGLAAESFLAYQQAAFRRAAPSGHTPHLHGTVAPVPDLPGGALLVDRIDGTAPQLPNDMPAIAEALGSLHTLTVPATAERPPLEQTDAVTEIVRRIESQSAHLETAGLPADTSAQIDEEHAWARGFAAAPLPAVPPALVGTDTHPGNFLIDGNGRAWFLDLEKAAYGNPAIDLAHASLPTSTGWDPDCKGSLSPTDITAFYDHYRTRITPDRWAQLDPWLLPARRLTWLRTITWFARWRGEFASSPAAPNDTAIRAHIEGHIDACLSPDAVAEVRAQWC